MSILVSKRQFGKGIFHTYHKEYNPSKMGQFNVLSVLANLWMPALNALGVIMLKLQSLPKMVNIHIML